MLTADEMQQAFNDLSVRFWYYLDLRNPGKTGKRVELYPPAGRAISTSDKRGLWARVYVDKEDVGLVVVWEDGTMNYGCTS